MNPSEIILEAREIRVIRGGAVLLDIPQLLIQQGEVLSLIGPNGAGKTTLLQTLSCLQRPSQGEVLYRGRRIHLNHSVIDYRRRLGMVFQEPLLFDTTVFDNVASGLKIRKMKRLAIQSIVEEQLGRFGIAHLSHRSARTLSGGEAQRASLARAFATQPEMLFLDEPFASLDPPSRESLIEDLEVILRETRTTTILATHDRLEAIRLSDRIAVMNEGKILQVGAAREVTHQPVNEFVASFVGVETILDGRVVKMGSGTLVASVEGREIEAVGDAQIGETVILCIRPENVTLSVGLEREATSARNVLSGKIEKIISLGLYQRIQIQCGFPLIAFVTNHSMEDLSLTKGGEVTASFKATAIHVIRKKEKTEKKIAGI